MADTKITIDVSQALAELAKLKGGMADAQAQAAKTGAAMDAAFSVEGAQGVADAVAGLQKEYDDLKKSADTLKVAIKGATDTRVVLLYARSIAQLELGMQQLEKTGKAAGVSLKEVNKQASTGKQVFTEFFGAITKVTLIVAVIQKVVEFTKASVALAEQVSKTRKALEGFTGSAAEADKIVARLIKTGQEKFIPTDEILQAGKALLAFGENSDNLPDVLGRIADVSAATGKNFNELTSIYGKARAAGVLYAEDINQLVDAGIPIIQEFAKQMGVSESQVKKLASEGKIGFEELQLAMFNLTAEGGKFANAAETQSGTIGGAWKKLVAVVQPAMEAIGSFVSNFVQGALNALRFVAEGIRDLFSTEPPTVKLDVDYTGRDAYEQEKSDRQERTQLEEIAEKARRERAKKAVGDAGKLERERQQAILNSMVDGIEKELLAEEFRHKAILKELRRFHLDTEGAEQQHKNNIFEIEQREAERKLGLIKTALAIRRAIDEADKKAVSDSEKEDKEQKDAEAARLKELLDLKLTEVDIIEEAGRSIIISMKKQGASKEKVREAELAIEQEVNRARLQAQLEFELAMLELIDGGDTAQINAALAKIDLIRAKIKNIDLDSGGAAPKTSLLERLGLDEQSIQELEDAKDSVLSALNEILDANVRNAEEDLRIAENKTQAAEDALAKEQELEEKGFANNVALAQKNLDQAKSDEAKALAQKKSAQRQQLALDAAQQVSSIVTTTVNIFRGFSGVPFVGVALAIAQVATLFAAIASIKSRASAISKLKHGGQGKVDGDGVIMGASHDAGGVAIEVEGGEFFATDGNRFAVVNKRMTSKHFDLLSAINKDDRPGILAAVARMDRDGVGNVVGAGSGSAAAIHGGDKVAHKLLRDIRDGGKTVTVSGGYRIEQKKGYKRRVKI